MPKITLQLLDDLEPMGFDDELFRTIHHFGQAASLKEHRKYCSKVHSFSGTSNDEVRSRLDFIRGSFKKWGGRLTAPPKDPVVLRRLVELAVIEYPVTLTDRTQS